MEAVLEPLMKKFFDQKMGHFVQVEPENMQFAPGSGQISMRKAEIKAEVFDQLHVPFTIKGGYMDEVTVQMPTAGFWGNESPATVKISNVFMVFGPHKTDWSYDHVYQCKSELIDLVMKVYDLKPAKKKNPNAAQKGGFLGDLKNKLIEDMKKRFLGMLEVNISGIHIRYEDAITQAIPFASGFKVGYVQVTSSQQNKTELRTQGNWKHSSALYADPLFSQNIKARRISTYWDLGKVSQFITVKKGDGKVDNGFTTVPVGGQEVYKAMRRLNIRETFSACVIEKIMTLFPVEHRRRKFLEGPGFRERLDFHQYVLFPASLSAHVLVNRNNAATQQQKAPQKDADVIFDPLEVAVDSEQVRSMNELQTHVSDFFRKDRLFRTRPRNEIKTYLVGKFAPPPAQGSSSSTAPRPPPTGGPRSESEHSQLKRTARQWWHHALHGVRILCQLPRSHLDSEELKSKSKLRDKYIDLVIQEMDQLDRDKAVAGSGASGAANARGSTKTTTLRDNLRQMQMELPVSEALEWRIQARDQRRERDGVKDDDLHHDPGSVAKEPEEAKAVAVPGPNTMQLHVHFRAFQAYFLVVADHFWNTAVKNVVPNVAAQSPSPAPIRGNTMVGNTLTRQLVVKAQMLDMHAEMVQKSRAQHRMARWFEFGIANVNVTNCNAKRTQHSVRQMLSMATFEHRPGMQLCIFVGVTMFEVMDPCRRIEPGDAVIASMLEPSQGTAAHLQELSQEEQQAMLRKLGFLKDYKDEVGRLMTFGFVRAGQVRALDYTPFRRRLLHFLKRGRTGPVTDLVRRPSPLALDRELLVKLQRKVQILTGKSNMLGFVECWLDGVRGRLVDHYNSQHVLCKELSLAPMRLKAFRNGCPQTFHVQFHQLVKDTQNATSLPPLTGDGFGLLPWKVAMLLLPKSEFQMGLDVSEEMDAKLDYERTARSNASAKKEIKQSVTQADEAVLAARDAADSVKQGAYFTKWNRNGRCKRRWVQFDEIHYAIVWKEGREDEKIIGALPLSKVQDICTDVKTPVLEKAKNQRNAKFQSDKVLSVVATERTLDLQADNLALRDTWILGLSTYYKRHVQRLEDTPPFPKAWEKQVRYKSAYPEKFRSQECGLRSTCRKLQAYTSLGKTMNTTGTEDLEQGGGGTGAV